MLQTVSKFLDSPLFRRFCSALVIVVIGVLAIRIMIRLLEKTLEKSHLEKAAHSLITSLSKAALYILLGLIAASALGIDVSSIVALASVLLSPLVGLTMGELTELRAARPRGTLYQAVLPRPEQSEKSRGEEKAEGFYVSLSHLRNLARTLPVDRLLDEILAHTGYLALAGAMRGGEVRRREVLDFLNLACGLGDLFTYCVTSVQLALAHPGQAGVLASLTEFLSIFALTQIPLAIVEGILSAIVVMMLESFAKPELREIGYLVKEGN